LYFEKESGLAAVKGDQIQMTYAEPDGGRAMTPHKGTSGGRHAEQQGRLPAGDDA